MAPTPWLWGLDSLADRSGPFRTIGLLLFASALLPPVARALPRIALSLERRRQGATAILAGVMILAAIMLLPSKNLILGDARVYISTIEKGMRAAGGAHREPLSQAVVTGIYEWVGGASIDGHGAFTLAGWILGAGLLFLAPWISRRVTSAPENRGLIYAALTLGGALQLVAGYPEYYGFAIVSILLFLGLCLRAIERSASPIPAAAAFVLACLCHAQAIFVAPALVLALAAAWRGGRRIESALAATAVPALGIVGLWLLRYPFSELLREGARGEAWLPPIGSVTPRTAYGIFHPEHFVDLANALLLSAPLLLPLAVLGLRRGRIEPSSRLLFAAAAGPALFAIAANPGLGMARDWDIFAVAALLLSLALASRARRIFASREGNALLGAMILTGALHAFFWIDTNHREGPPVERMRRIATAPALFGPRSLGELWRYIGSEDVAAGREERAAESWLRSVAADPDERMTYRLLAGLEAARATGRGEPPGSGIDRFLERIRGIPHRAAYARMGAALAAFTHGDGDRAIAEAVRMIEIEPDHAELLAMCGDFLRFGGHDAEARNAYDRALDRDPDQPRARIGLACMAGIAGDRAGLARETAEARRRTPWAPQVQQFERIASSPEASSPERLRRYIYIR